MSLTAVARSFSDDNATLCISGLMDDVTDKVHQISHLMDSNVKVFKCLKFLRQYFRSIAVLMHRLYTVDVYTPGIVRYL